MNDRQRQELFDKAVETRDAAQSLIAMLIRFDKENMEKEIASKKEELAKLKEIPRDT